MQRKAYGTRGKYPQYTIYFDQLDRLRLASKVLNAGASRPGDVHQPIWSREGIQGRISEMTEAVDRNQVGDLVQGLIPAQEAKLTQLEKDFQWLKTKCQNEGRTVPDEMPVDMLNKRLVLEAKLDVLNEELACLQGWLEKLPLPEQEQLPELMPFGLKQASHFWGSRTDDPDLMNVIREMDGQSVDFIDGVLCIVDKRSPYNGMALIDYRRLSNEWLAKRREEDARKLESLREQAKSEGKPLPGHYLRPGTRVSPSSLPKWPTWAVNYLEKEVSTEKE